MPWAPKRPCTHPGCQELTDDGTCERHKLQGERERGNANERGYTYRWHKERTAYLSRNPLCAECERGGQVKAATVVDHIRPHRGDVALFWDRRNWQALCTNCHNIKTAEQDGRWG